MKLPRDSLVPAAVAAGLFGGLLILSDWLSSKGSPPASDSRRVFLSVFPVGVEGHPNFGPTYGSARSGGRSHQGVDVFAKAGTPVFAVANGYLSFGSNDLGGIVAHITDYANVVYYYAHLQSVEGVNRQVKAGEVIGYVGNTGNASSTPSHLHFEIRPNNQHIDPFPSLVAVAPKGSITRA